MVLFTIPSSCAPADFVQNKFMTNYSDGDVQEVFDYALLSPALIERQQYKVSYVVCLVIPYSSSMSGNVTAFVNSINTMINNKDYSDLYLSSNTADAKITNISFIQTIGSKTLNTFTASGSSSTRSVSNGSLFMYFTVETKTNCFLSVANASTLATNIIYQCDTKQPYFNMKLYHKDPTLNTMFDLYYWAFDSINCSKISDFYEVTALNEGRFIFRNNLIASSVASNDNIYILEDTIKSCSISFDGYTTSVGSTGSDSWNMTNCNIVSGFTLSLYNYKFKSFVMYNSFGGLDNLLSRLSYAPSSNNSLTSNTSTTRFMQDFPIQTAIFDCSYGAELDLNNSTVLTGGEDFYSKYYKEPAAWYDIPTYLYNFLIFLCFGMPLTSSLMAPLGSMVVVFGQVWADILIPLISALGIFGIAFVFIIFYKLIKRFVFDSGGD